MENEIRKEFKKEILLSEKRIHARMNKLDDKTDLIESRVSTLEGDKKVTDERINQMMSSVENLITSLSNYTDELRNNDRRTSDNADYIARQKKFLGWCLGICAGIITACCVATILK